MEISNIRTQNRVSLYKSALSQNCNDFFYGSLYQRKAKTNGTTPFTLRLLEKKLNCASIQYRQQATSPKTCSIMRREVSNKSPSGQRPFKRESLKRTFSSRIVVRLFSILRRQGNKHTPVSSFLTFYRVTPIKYQK